MFRSVPLQGCSVKLERRYIEVDEEIVSVTTDLDGLFFNFCLVLIILSFYWSHEFLKFKLS